MTIGLMTDLFLIKVPTYVLDDLGNFIVHKILLERINFESEMQFLDEVVNW